MSGDGYYYREVGQAVAAGPHTWGEFQKLRAAGKISVRSKAWKQGGGQIFAVRGFITCALSYRITFHCSRSTSNASSHWLGCVLLARATIVLSSA
jgi:hypothetical protein